MADLVTVNEYKDAEGIRGEKEDDRLNVLVGAHLSAEACCIVAEPAHPDQRRRRGEEEDARVDR